MLSLSIASAVYRALGLMLSLALLPRSMVPWIVKLALIFSIVLLMSGAQEHASGFLSGQDSSSTEQLMAQLFLGPESSSMLSLLPGAVVSWSYAMAELSFGILTGLVLSVSAYSVFLLGQWLSATLASPGLLRERLQRNSCESFRPFLLIFFLALFFASDAPAQLVTIVGHSLLLIPSAQVLESSHLQSLAFTLISSLGVLAFEVALLVAAPFLLSFMAIDFSLVVVERYFSGTVKLNYPLKIMGACILLSFGVYVLHEQLLSMITETVINFDDATFFNSLR